jgi:hypothetical protein
MKEKWMYVQCYWMRYAGVLERYEEKREWRERRVC